jgi:glutathione S-transferase
LLDLEECHGAGSSWGFHKLSAEQKAAFYRWFIFIPANLYPLRTLFSFPQRFLEVPSQFSAKNEEAEKWLSDGAERKRKESWKLLEQYMNDSPGRASPFMVGSPTILDVAVTVLAHWGPGWPEDPSLTAKWMAQQCPNVAYACQSISSEFPVITETLRENKFISYIRT